jgi:hypothetical protein
LGNDDVVGLLDVGVINHSVVVYEAGGLEIISDLLTRACHEHDVSLDSFNIWIIWSFNRLDRTDDVSICELGGAKFE